MKNKLLIFALAVLAIVITSCSFDEGEAFSKNLAPASDIQFVVDQSALLAASSTVVQPSYDVIAARFVRTGSTKVRVNVSSSDLTKLTVNYLGSNTSGVVRQIKSTLDIAGGTAEWSYPMNTLGLNGAAVTTGTVVIEFVASSADGSSSVTRVLSITGF